MRLPLSLLSIGCLCAAATAAGTVAANAITADEVISKARARIGSETALNGIKTLSYEISLYVPARDKDGKTVVAKDKDGKVIKDKDGKDALQQQRSYLQVDYKAPVKRREYLLANNSTLEIIRASNGLEGFQKITQLFGNKQAQLKAFTSAELKNFADLYEVDMEFFAKPKNGEVKYEGEEFLKDLSKKTYALEYIYKNGLRVKRYFDASDFALLRYEVYSDNTPADRRSVHTLSGELIVDGLKFPQVIRVEGTAAEGEKTVTTLEYQNVKVNGKGLVTIITPDKDDPNNIEKAAKKTETRDLGPSGVVLDEFFAYPKP